MAYPTISEIRDAVGPPFDDEDRFTDELLTRLIAEFIDIAERYRGVAFAQRTTTETRELGCSSSIHLDWAEPVSITSISIDGDTLDASDYVLVADLGRVDFRAGSSSGVNGFVAIVSVVYLHGTATTPPAIFRGCIEYVRATAVSDRSGSSRDVISQTFDGGVTRYSTPDWDAGRPTGWLEVDRLLNGERDRRISTGIA